MAPEDAKATIEQLPQSTGRDGAVDLVVKMHAFGVLPHSAAARELYCSSNGTAGILFVTLTEFLSCTCPMPLPVDA